METRNLFFISVYQESLGGKRGKKGKVHRDKVSGLTLPAYIEDGGSLKGEQEWYKRQKDVIDNNGLIVPAFTWIY